jgi:hypothetical protein
MYIIVAEKKIGEKTFRFASYYMINNEENSLAVGVLCKYTDGDTSR